MLNSNHKISINRDIKSSKKYLHNLNHSGYIDSALAKSKVRIGTLNSYLATHDAQSVFFCVNACAHLFINISSMVALMGHPKGWLGHQVTSSSNPANVTANEIGTSSGDYVNHYLEAVTMTTIPNEIVSKFSKILSNPNLAKIEAVGYIYIALAKSSVGCGSLNQVADQYRLNLRFFCIRITPIFSMVGRSVGAYWLAGFYLTSLPTSLRLIAQFGSCSMRLNKLQVEGCLMTTIPTPIIYTQKLYKFYDLSTAQVVQTTATTEHQARKSLGKSSLIFIARIRLYPIVERSQNWGGYIHD